MKDYTMNILKGIKLYSIEEYRALAKKKEETANKLTVVNTVVAVTALAVTVLAKKEATKVRAVIILITSMIELGIMLNEKEIARNMKKFAEKTEEELELLNKEVKEKREQEEKERQ